MLGGLCRAADRDLAKIWLGQPILAHRDVHGAHVAAEAIAGELQGDQELASAAFYAEAMAVAPN